MPKQQPKIRFREPATRLRLWDRLLYLPGALILVFGFWLSLTA